MRWAKLNLSSVLFYNGVKERGSISIEKHPDNGRYMFQGLQEAIRSDPKNPPVRVQINGYHHIYCAPDLITHLSALPGSAVSYRG